VVNQDLSDEQLLGSARAGDRDALQQLLERHQAQVYRFGLKMCRHPEDAKDVLQDTLLAVARGVRDFRGASSLSTWLYTVARSFCIKKRRRGQFAPQAEQSLETDVTTEARQLPSPERHPDEALAGKQVEHALEQAISSLEPICREVLLLRDVEGLSAPEVAEVLGVSVQAVKSRLHRARVAVRERIAPLLDADLSRPAVAVGGCPDVLTLFSQHLEDEISAEVCAEMERHLEKCGRCRGACDSLKRTLALCRSSTVSVEVPPSIQSSVRTALRSYLTEQP
jgi:RNA polymerase sigma-70 factor (ECF subfamily)